MSELSEAHGRMVVGWFLDAYNAVHGTAYVYESAEPREDASCDYACSTASRPGDLLKIQLTRPSPSLSAPASADDEAERTFTLHAFVNMPYESRPSATGWSKDNQLLLDAVRKKACRLGPSAFDLVLLVYFDLVSYDEDIDLDDMQGCLDGISGGGFREVWVTCETDSTGGRADRVWPR